MELIINGKEFSIFTREVPKEVVGYNFYSVAGTFYGRHKVGEKGYPRASYRILLNLNGKEVELPQGSNLYLTNEGKYFIGSEV